jgi:hypothetical protein
MFDDKILRRLSGQDWQAAIDGFLAQQGDFISAVRRELGTAVCWEVLRFGLPIGTLTLSPRPGGGYELHADPRGGFLPHPPNAHFDKLLAELDAALVDRTSKMPEPPRVPKRPADLARWKAAWRLINAQRMVGMSQSKIATRLAGYKTPGVGFKLEFSPDTIGDIVRAGEAGLLNTD